MHTSLSSAPVVKRMPEWAIWLPVAFIVLSLLLLLLVPLLIRQQTSAIQDEIDQTARPARDLVEAMELVLAREVSAVRGLLLTGHEPYRDVVLSSIEEAQQYEDELAVLARELGPEVQKQLNKVREAKNRWLGPNVELIEGRLPPEVYIRQIPVQQDRYDATMLETRNLKRSITRVVDARRQEIQNAEWIGVVITVFLAGFAFLSVVLVFWFSRRLRRLTFQLEKQAKQESALRRTAEAAVRTRDEVMAVVSHDLRSPLAAITMGLTLLNDTALSEQEKGYIVLIKRSASQMNLLIQDLLDVIKLEAGKPLPMHRECIDAGMVMEEVHASFQGPAQEKLVQVELEVPDDLPPVEGDRRRLTQVVTNLVGNAVKFTPSGGTIRLSAVPEADMVCFAVSDTGIGIDGDHLERIFERFWQAGRTSHLGAGLGLAISKGIVESHGGRIWVESMPGRGSTFYFTLPQAATTEAAPSADTAGPGWASEANAV